MRGIKISLHDFALKMQGGLMREGGGAYLLDTTVCDFDVCMKRILGLLTTKKVAFPDRPAHCI